MELAKKRLLDTTTITSTTPASNAMITVPSGKTYLVQLLTAYNPNATSENLNVFRVPDSAGAVGTADLSSNRLFRLQLAAYESVTVELPGGGWVLEDENDSVQFSISVNPVVVAVDGTEVS